MKTRRNWRLFPVISLSIVVIAGGMSPAGAQELSESVYLSGFVSQGYLNTSRNDYLVARSINGTAEFTEAAIIGSAQPTDRLRVGIQLLARNFGQMGNGKVVVDWAFGDYRYRDELGIRAGKVKLPFGLYNEGRDVDILRTSVFLPQSVYPESIRDLILAYNGAGIYGNLTLGGAGDVEYHFYGGTLNVSDLTGSMWTHTYEAAAIEVEEAIGHGVDLEYGLPQGTAQARFRELAEPEVTFPWIWGGSLVWNTPLVGLRIGSTFMNGRYHYRSRIDYDVRIPVAGGVDQWLPYRLDVDETTAIDQILTVSGEFVHEDLTVTSELYQDKVSASKALGWYGMATYRFSDVLSAGAYYSRSWTDRGDKDGDRYVRAGLPDYFAWQNDLAISTRFDINDFWLFKLEYHFIDGMAQVNPRSLLSNAPDTPDRHWGMLTAKTTFVF